MSRLIMTLNAMMRWRCEMSEMMSQIYRAYKKHAVRHPNRVDSVSMNQNTLQHLKASADFGALNVAGFDVDRIFGMRLVVDDSLKDYQVELKGEFDQSFIESIKVEM